VSGPIAQLQKTLVEKIEGAIDRSNPDTASTASGQHAG
jgi:hypothetical protein